MSFRLVATDGRARAGVLATSHGDVPTPVFMPVATTGSVRTLSTRELVELGAHALIANSWSLTVRPGLDHIGSAGGLHAFMRWPRALFTDSGGFQTIKRGLLVRKGDEGLTLRHPATGEAHLLTPEGVMEVEARLGADVAMVLDDCPVAGAPPGEVDGATRRTTEWAHRCLEAHPRGGQLLFAITQGGVVPELRARSTRELSAMPFDGYGIGGLSIGEPVEEMNRTIRQSIDLLPADRPRYLMGVGSPKELLDAIAMGVDVFDSAFPTRGGRHGTVLARRGRYDITRGAMGRDTRPLDPACGCRACATHDRAYVHHLWRSNDPRWMHLVSYHNVALVLDLVRGAREAIGRGAFEGYRASWAGQ
jgi:queuine tRNA-ribosyltransferase